MNNPSIVAGTVEGLSWHHQEDEFRFEPSQKYIGIYIQTLKTNVFVSKSIFASIKISLLPDEDEGGGPDSMIV